MNHREFYRRLRDAYLDGTASQADVDELRQYLKSSDELLDDYIEHANQDAALLWDGLPEYEPPLPQPSSASNRMDVFWRYAPLVAATLLFAVSVGWEWIRSTPKPVATILSSTNCHWGTGTLPTSVGQELQSGRLRLISGIAELQFPKVTVSMEGPVDIELISAERCRLHSGSIVGSVSEGGEGFVVETPRAEIVDGGTKFGVFVDNLGDARLDVLEGKVDVRHFGSGRQLTVNRSNQAFASEETIETFDPKLKARLQKQQEARNSIDNVIHVSSASGNGEEGDVTSGDREEGDEFPRPDHALLVKHSSDSDEWNRKAFVRFDLTGVDASELSRVDLRLEGIPTGMGYTSLVPDSTFHVFGVKPEFDIDWNSRTLDQTNFPGRLGDTFELDPAKVQLLGEFVVPQSQPVGQFVVTDPRLQQFIEDELGSSPTLVVTRVTSAAASQSYVHGFASRTHPTATPPTLRLQIKQQSAE
ncbi:FecR family protein [Aporhodopirellula aestuarii]|uniref:Iron dicitrate transport regulator FecR n=1 Tax=Aporhodopirellula aestuarii TaxID=2950107 RepID=A0ABT0U2Y1_9BACT|nr:iron dicitrate transport regulator FecR [Aporhodopirellula aestuarii]MCM2371254.1 iron dicitrate transport regulator FecR [Aporhodopirellula aestuarii]